LKGIGSMNGVMFIVGILFGLFAFWASTKGNQLIPERTMLRMWVWLSAWANARLAARRQFEIVFASTHRELSEMNELATLITDRETCRMVQEILARNEA
jgi:hypothetical protein